MSSRTSRVRTVLAAAGVVAGLCSAVGAHPHVWIEASTDVVFDADGRIAAIHVEWLFDDVYSAAAVDGLDTDGDGHYSAEELKELTDEQVASLAEYDYFTYAKCNGQKLKYGKLTEYGQIYKSDKRLMLYFTVPLAEPLDPRKADMAYTIHDPSFYIAIEMAKEGAIQTVGKMPPQCRVEMRKPASEQKGSSESWSTTLQNAEDMGALFASPVVVTCKPKTAS
jgi:ABC-type uncharacterized transport system substrate-binding protein